MKKISLLLIFFSLCILSRGQSAAQKKALEKAKADSARAADSQKQAKQAALMKAKQDSMTASESHKAKNVIEPFDVKGGAKLIAAWNSKQSKPIYGNLVNGDKVKIGLPQSDGFKVSVIHNEEEIQLLQDAERKGDLPSDSTVVKVYQYDFGQDDDKEIMIVYSFYFSVTHVKVFRYSDGLAKLVGDFSGQIEVVLDKNIISLPYGSQGLTNEYIYRNGAFYELEYLNPNQKSIH
jgi:hypothetical protein